jgi:hypothetical protein
MSHLHQYGHPPERYSPSRVVPQMQTGTQCSNIISCSSVYSWMCLFNSPFIPRERKNDPAQAYEAQSSLHSALNHALGSSKGNWLIPALHVVCRNTHRAAALADESTGNRNDHARLQNAVTLLQSSYSKTLNDRVELRVSI